ncbi:MAG: tRNA (N6-isopentenyl adenosine(37)-C2)-methylthiotransferase MiaB, partial [Oscillospiraceae bacterium]
MNRTTTVISQEEIDRQKDFCARVLERNTAAHKSPLAFVDTYGCQQNEADSERIRGYLAEMGYGFTQDENEADVIVINTCAVREHAEDRVLGNVGALVHTKRRKPSQIICLCGCMMQEPRVAAKIKDSYRHVDIVFGPHALWKFPELLWRVLSRRGRVFDTEDQPGSVAEGIPVVRQSAVKAWVSIMYGCNNFCTYCIVPYVRGRERSRRPEVILDEVRQLAAEGYKDITLLGQNVNSYGKDLEEDVDFAWLLEQVNAIPGDFLIRFMTSHPKDATERLFDAMAHCEKVAPVIHLPFQAGNDRVLKAMNRGYTYESYLAKIKALRERIPDIVLTSDVIVGFPGETTEEFEDTLKLIKEVRYDALFTFIYSPRPGTP